MSTLANEASFLHTYLQSQGFLLGRAQQPTCTPDGSVLFVRARTPEATLDLYEFVSKTRQIRCLLRPEDLLGNQAEMLSPEEQALRERLRLSAHGIATFRLSPGGNYILIPLSGLLFLYNRSTKTWRSLPTGPAFAPQWAPTEDCIAYVREGDVYLYNLSSETPTKITHRTHPDITYGMAEFVAQEEMSRYCGFWFSPDGDSLAISEVDNRSVEHWTIPDVAHPERPPLTTAYPRAGTNNASVRLGIFGRDGSFRHWVLWNQNHFPYMAQVRWQQGGPLSLVLQDRAQKNVQLVTVDESNGKTRCLLEEHDDTWINLDSQMPHWLDNGTGFLWVHERTGGPALGLYKPDGSFQQILVPATAGYQHLVYVSTSQNTLWVSASTEPTERHIYRVSLSGGELQALTTTTGIHQLVMNPAQGIWVHTYASPEKMPVTQVHTTREEVISFDTLSAFPLDNPAQEPPWIPNSAFLQTTSAQFRTFVIKPHNFDPTQKYPVLVDVYGGPGHSHVLKSMRYFLLNQWLANQGFIVIGMDGRGSPGRGRLWERAIAGNFAEVALEDQISGLQALLTQDASLDGNRIGIFGWSFGGTMAALAVLRRPDLFHAAIAGAPVTDWHYYDTHYTERYLGMPQENVEGYQKNSPLFDAHALSRPLTILHGTADDNVFFSHAVQFSHALWLANKPHCLVPLVGATHMAANPDHFCRKWETIRDFFIHSLSFSVDPNRHPFKKIDESSLAVSRTHPYNKDTCLL